MGTKIICVFNKQEFFEKVIVNCKYHKNCEFFGYDNTKENTALTKHYNYFIEENIPQDATPENSDFWCVFMHQDFAFQEDIDLALKNLDKNFIYGPIGIKFLTPNLCQSKERFKPTDAICFGKILQMAGSQFIHYGCEIKEPTIVDTVDCCCIIMHSSLIRKFNLRFDENLSFHMYAEELCYRARRDYELETKANQFHCFHLGAGTTNEEFKNSAQYLKAKFNINKIPSTCDN